MGVARRCLAVTRPLLLALVVALAAFDTACASGTTPTQPRSERSTALPPEPPPIAARIRLRPLTRSERDACIRLAASKPLPVICPTVLPRPLPAAPATPIGVHTFHVCQAFGMPSGCPLYDFAVLYGAPDERPGHAASNTPLAFLHFEILGGRRIDAAVDVHGLSGDRRLQRPLGSRTIAGHRGRLYFGLPYSEGGGEYGSHYTFVWRQGGWGYAASLHSWTPHTQTLAVLAAILADLKMQTNGAR